MSAPLPRLSDAQCARVAALLSLATARTPEPVAIEPARPAVIGGDKK